MKTTVTLFDIIDSELKKAGNNEVFNIVDGVPKITIFDDKFATIKKISKYDEDVKKIVDDIIFGGLKIDSNDVDLKFKKMFINNFSSREIKYQTLDLFQNNLISYTIQNEVLITQLCTKLLEYYQNESNISNTKSDLNGSNSGDATLPQDVVNLDLKSDTMEYADENKVIRGFDNSNGETTNISFNSEVFDKLNNQIEILLKRFDNKLFLQIW